MNQHDDDMIFRVEFSAMLMQAKQHGLDTRLEKNRRFVQHVAELLTQRHRQCLEYEAILNRRGKP